ncbi:bola-like protein-domain-containing protein [Gorgonomyces haynaldii]|nr:bola-like protein-domain-containing protein [Gorgonomyces haynaldii]
MSQFLKSFMQGPIGQSIHRKLTEQLKPSFLEINDDSHRHRNHAAMKGLNASETHFRLVVVSDRFKDLKLVQRHQLVYQILDQEIKDGVHALQMTCKTPQEYQPKA